MKTIEVRIPEPLFQQAQELAVREGIPVDQVLSMAISQALGIWGKEAEIQPASKSADRQRFLERLQQALDGSHSLHRYPPPHPA